MALAGLKTTIMLLSDRQKSMTICAFVWT